MRIDQVHIKGFRNFSDETIIFQQKTLIIGANDVGKTNLIYALRLLFDKSISEQDLELTDSDYNAYSETEQIEITATICDVTEDCLLSEFKGNIKDGTVVIRYVKPRDEAYSIQIGFSEETLSEYPTRHYIKRLNMQCVDTNRDLFSFLKRERVQMLRLAKERLTEEQAQEDEKSTIAIQNNLDIINGQVSSLHYVSTALEHVNKELSDLSFHNEDQTVRFVAGESEAGKLLDNLTLSYSTVENPLTPGGDGRNNQIFLATWIAKQNIQENVDHVTFYAIEEPEAHLHPHQQRRLSEYIQNNFKGQVLITSHSPHIASRFDPRCIIRLYTKQKITHAACGGCSEMLKRVFSEFNYRLNALSAETFFSDGVFLVEGVSEVMLYTDLANKIEIDLDRYNISILSVEGIGFKPYVAVCNALNIPWVLRTDNDIFSKPKNSPIKKYYAGVSRVMGILELWEGNTNELVKYWTEHKSDNEWSIDGEIPDKAKSLNAHIKKQTTLYNIYLSDTDLESDLANGPLNTTLLSYYNKRTTNTLVKAMKEKKGENMFSFLSKHRDSLDVLAEDPIAAPLKKLKQLIEERMHPGHG